MFPKYAITFILHFSHLLFTKMFQLHLLLLKQYCYGGGCECVLMIFFVLDSCTFDKMVMVCKIFDYFHFCFLDQMLRSLMCVRYLNLNVCTQLQQVKKCNSSDFFSSKNLCLRFHAICSESFICYCLVHMIKLTMMCL